MKNFPSKGERNREINVSFHNSGEKKVSTDAQLWFFFFCCNFLFIYFFLPLDKYNPFPRHEWWCWLVLNFTFVILFRRSKMLSLWETLVFSDLMRFGGSLSTAGRLLIAATPILWNRPTTSVRDSCSPWTLRLLLLTHHDFDMGCLWSVLFFEFLNVSCMASLCTKVIAGVASTDRPYYYPSVLIGDAVAWISF